MKKIKYSIFFRVTDDKNKSMIVIDEFKNKHLSFQKFYKDCGFTWKGLSTSDAMNLLVEKEGVWLHKWYSPRPAISNTKPLLELIDFQIEFSLISDDLSLEEIKEKILKIQNSYD